MHTNILASLFMCRSLRVCRGVCQVSHISSYWAEFHKKNPHSPFHHRGNGTEDRAPWPCQLPLGKEERCNQQRRWSRTVSQKCFVSCLFENLWSNIFFTSMSFFFAVKPFFPSLKMPLPTLSRLYLKGILNYK